MTGFGFNSALSVMSGVVAGFMGLLTEVRLLPDRTYGFTHLGRTVGPTVAFEPTELHLLVTPTCLGFGSSRDLALLVCLTVRSSDLGCFLSLHRLLRLSSSSEEM